MNPLEIQKNGRSIRYNSDDIVEKIARRLVGRYLGVSAMYFSRPALRHSSVDLAGDAAEKEKAVDAAGAAAKAEAPSKASTWKAIQSVVVSYLFVSGTKRGKIFSAGIF